MQIATIGAQQPVASAIDPLLASLERQERMQRALAACSQRLMGNTADAVEERQALYEALAHLRDGAQVLRVGLFENFTHPEDGFSSRLVVGAAAPGEPPLHELFGADHHIPWSRVPEANLRALEAGAHIGGPVEQLFAGAPQIIEVERRLGIGTVQFFPIAVDRQWWGYLAFDDQAVRPWDAQEVLLIRTAAEIVSVFLQRNRDVAALREREAMLRALGDHLPDAIVYQLEDLPNGQTRRTYMSRGLERRTGISAEQVLASFTQRPFSIYPEDLPGYQLVDQLAQVNLTPFDHEFRYIAADGSVRWVRARSSPRRAADGRLLWDGIAFDTTAYRQLQESLRQANLGLNRRVDELSLLNQIAQLLNNVTSLPETLAIVCRLLRETFHASAVLVALRKRPADMLQVVASHTIDADEPIDLPDLLGDIRLEQALLERRAFIADTPGAAASILIVPLRTQHDLLGILGIKAAHAQYRFAPDTVSLAQTIGSAITNAAANVQLYERAVHSGERLERLNAASRMINGAGLDLSALYTAIHQAVAHLMPVEAFVISLVEAGSQVVEHVYGYDAPKGRYAPGQAPIAHSFAAFMRGYGPTLRVDDFQAFYARHPQVQLSVYGDDDTRSGVAASFLTADGLYGLLFAQCYPPGMYHDDDVTILELLAAHAATAIENARRARIAQRTAIDEERNRLARDLHDSVSQSLFSASLIAEQLPAMARINSKAASDGLQTLHQLVRGALIEMRALLIELRPAALAEAPLHVAIDQLANAFTARRGIPIAVALDPAPQVPPMVQEALYRIVQECLNNALKHAQARTIGVQMAVEPAILNAETAWTGTLTLTVTDNGRGFVIDQLDPTHLGLGIMRERAAAIGALLQIASRPGAGTQISVTWSNNPRREDS